MSRQEDLHVPLSPRIFYSFLVSEKKVLVTVFLNRFPTCFHLSEITPESGLTLLI